jgi:hypothetical protein
LNSNSKNITPPLFIKKSPYPGAGGVIGTR